MQYDFAFVRKRTWAIEIMAKILHDKTTLFFNHDHLGHKTIRKIISDAH